MMSNADKFLDEDIREEFKKHRSVFRTARALGITLDRVSKALVQDLHLEIKNPSEYDGWGKPELRHYVVARKHITEQWDNEEIQIKTARSLFEKGTHELVNGRDGDWNLLYSIPRAVSQPRPNYFSNRD